MRDWITWTVERRRVIQVAHAAVLAIALSGLPRLGIANSPQAFFVDDARELERYREFKALFGRDQTLRLVVEGERLWTREGLDWLGRVEREVATVFGVVGTAGLYSHHRLRYPEWPPPDPAALRREAISDPLDRAAGWVDAEGTTATVMVLLYDLPPRRLQEVAEKVRERAAAAPEGLQVSMVGLPVLAAALDRAVLDVVVETFPALVVAAVLLLVWVLRSPTAIGVVLLQVGFVVGTLFGIVGWQGHPLDMVQSVLGPIVFVVTLANALYLLVELRYRLAAAGDGESALDGLIATYRERGWAVLWAGLTTAIGFGSLLLSESPPIRALGVWTALGLALATLEAFVLLPTLLWRLAVRPVSDPRGGESRPPLDLRLRRSGRSLASWAVGHRTLVTVVFGATSLVAALGLTRLEVGVGLLDYFEPRAPVRTRIEALEQRGIGVAAADLVLRSGEAAERHAGSATAIDFRQSDALETLALLTENLRRLPGVLAVLSPSDLAAAGERLPAATDAAAPAGEAPSESPAGAGTPPDGSSGLARLLADPRTGAMTRSAIGSGGSAARVHLQFRIRSWDELTPLFESAVAEARVRFPEAEVWLTGIYPLVLEGQRSLLKTMLLSLGLTLLFVVIVFGVLVRRWRTLLAVTIPNLWPVLFVVGLMGWISVPLDSTTLMIAAVVLGLSVDDTLHSLGAFRRRAPRSGAREGAIETVEHTIAGHLLTSLVLALGFASCSLSSFVPVARFGLLAAAGIVAALVADLLLVPVLLASLRRQDVAVFERAQGASVPVEIEPR